MIMQLTGECDKEFLEYLSNQKFGISHNIGERQPNIVDLAKEFIKLPDSMKFGVYQDYFDTVKMPFEVEQLPFGHYYFYVGRLGSKTKYKTRPEARTEAIKKANEIRNNQLTTINT